MKKSNIHYNVEKFAVDFALNEIQRSIIAVESESWADFLSDKKADPLPWLLIPGKVVNRLCKQKPPC